MQIYILFFNNILKSFILRILKTNFKLIYRGSSEVSQVDL